MSYCWQSRTPFGGYLTINDYDDDDDESEKGGCKVAKGCFATRQNSPDLINLAGNFHQLVFLGGKGLPKHDFSCMKNNSEQDSLKFTFLKLYNGNK